jgi:hypothetical protein
VANSVLVAALPLWEIRGSSPAALIRGCLLFAGFLSAKASSAPAEEHFLGESSEVPLHEHVTPKIGFCQSCSVVPNRAKSCYFFAPQSPLFDPSNTPQD